MFAYRHDGTGNNVINEVAIVRAAPSPPAAPWAGGTTRWTFTGFDADGSAAFRTLVEDDAGGGGPWQQFSGNVIHDVNGDAAKRVLLAANTRMSVTDDGGWVFEREPSPRDLDQHTEMTPVDYAGAQDGL